MKAHHWLKAMFQRARLHPLRPDNGEGDHSEDDWVDGWIKQQQRVKQALAAARQLHATAAPAKAADEWVDDWIKQQKRVSEAFALAGQMHAQHLPVDTNDDWVDGWVRQQQRVRQALAAAKLRSR